ncbi:hypothetical protein BCR34DRAFT_599165 [Clohesyomyces aquaticus]|uniref:Uncharacterized protein n=1 Tax=Clohesyomyces aquaticus TaxID=1231657 RepID=A0A1Y1ZVV2_9PLEO|nr:hypothetical protein BCR34DRAFT_599165 [Clohesyomyces aquaticus]
MSYLNGILVVAAKVSSSQEYQETMHRLSLWSYEHVAAMGLPTRKDVGIVSTLIKALKKEAEKVLGFEIKSAIASVPRFPPIYEEDLYDAFEYAGIQKFAGHEFSLPGAVGFLRNQCRFDQT